MQRPDVAALGDFRSFLSLPYCPTLRSVCTGGSRRPLFPSVGLTSPHRALPSSSTEGHILQVPALEWAAGRATAAMRFVGHCLSQADLSPPRRREKSVPGILARVPACPLRLGTPPPHPSLTPESRAGSIHPPHGTARVRASVPSPTPRHPLGSPLLHPLQNTTSKELGGTESFFLPGTGSRFVEQEPIEVEGGGPL